MSFLDIGFPGSSTGKEFACNTGDPRSSLVWNIPWRRDRLPTPVFLGFPAGSVVKESTCNVGDLGSILGWEGPLKKGMAMYSCLENPHGQRSWWAAVHGVLESDTTEQLSSYKFSSVFNHWKKKLVWNAFFPFGLFLNNTRNKYTPFL